MRQRKNTHVLKKEQQAPSVEEEPYPFCHLYAQESWHGEAYISATRAGLEKLRDAINLTLEKGNTKNTFWPNDLESHDLFINCLEEENFNTLSLPYTLNIHQPEANQPYDLLKKPYYTLDK